MPRISKEHALERVAAEHGLTRGCVMCALTGKDKPGDIVAESRVAVVRLNRFGCTRGHLTVIARAHVERTTDLGWRRYVELQRLVFRAVEVLERSLRPKRVFVAALGSPKPLSNSFPHYHVHVVPVFDEGERARPAYVLSWTSGVTVYSDASARRLCAKLRGEWSR